MDVPAPAGGVVKDVKVKVGDKVSKGSLVLVLDAQEGGGATAKEKVREEAAQKASAPAGRAEAPAGGPPARKAERAEGGSQERPSERSAGREERSETPAVRPSEPASSAPTLPATAAASQVDEAGFALAHASPSVRRLARELGVDLGRVRGTGPKARILKEDVHGFVKEALTRPQAPAGGALLDLPAWPKVDFSKFGAVESVPLSRIQKLSGAFLARNWVMIPHVTQHDEADITELEAFRKEQAEAVKKTGARLTLLAFIVKAAVAALRQFPQFNASLGDDGASLVLKKYYHIGVAVDTPEGLVVPVIRDADRKGVLEIARALAEVSSRARDKKLAPTDMQGGSFSISSLGGIGGTAFTPIINAPEVAILGVARSQLKPQYVEGELHARLMLPLSLSYDHRVIDGAQGARFTAYLGAVLSDIRRLVL
jgi:pyruvate dehydrogenase E2 component (dihydrolipoamide acetyltransferase)